MPNKKILFMNYKPYSPSFSLVNLPTKTFFYNITLNSNIYSCTCNNILTRSISTEVSTEENLENIELESFQWADKSSPDPISVVNEINDVIVNEINKSNSRLTSETNSLRDKLNDDTNGRLSNAALRDEIEAYEVYVLEEQRSLSDTLSRARETRSNTFSMMEENANEGIYPSSNDVLTQLEEAKSLANSKDSEIDMSQESFYTQRVETYSSIVDYTNPTIADIVNNQDPATPSLFSGNSENDTSEVSLENSTSSDNETSPVAPVNPVPLGNETSPVVPINPVQSDNETPLGVSNDLGDNGADSGQESLNQDQVVEESNETTEEQGYSIREMFERAESEASNNSVESKDTLTNSNAPLDDTTNKFAVGNSKRKREESVEETSREPSPKKLKAEETPNLGDSAVEENLNPQPESSSTQNVASSNPNSSLTRPNDGLSPVDYTIGLEETTMPDYGWDGGGGD